MADWVKLHTDLLDNPDCSEISPLDYMIFTFLLMLARREECTDGVLAGWTHRRLAYRFRQSEEQIGLSLAALERVGWITSTPDSVTITNFLSRQYDNPSDQPAATRDRQRKHRDAATSHENVTTMSRPGHETEQNRTEQTREEENRQEAAALNEDSLPPQPGDDQPTLSASPTLAAKLDILREFGIPPSQGYELAERNSLANIQNWIAHLQNAPNVKNPAGLLVTRLRESATAPLPGGNHGTADPARRGRRASPSDAEWADLARKYNGKPGPSPGAMLAV